MDQALGDFAVLSPSAHRLPFLFSCLCVSSKVRKKCFSLPWAGMFNLAARGRMPHRLHQQGSHTHTPQTPHPAAPSSCVAPVSPSVSPAVLHSTALLPGAGTGSKSWRREGKPGDSSCCRQSNRGSGGYQAGFRG